MSDRNAIETQALYGQKVYVLQRKGDWDRIAVPGQLTPKNVLGYPGWVPDVQLTRHRTLASLQSKPFAMVDAAPTAWLYDDAALTKKFLLVSFDTRLPVLRRTATAVEVATPDVGPKWFAAGAVTVFNTAADIPSPDAAALIKTGKLFMGLPYLWGGRSGFMLDCSGFTSLVYASHGVTITRDAVPMVAPTGAVRTRSRQLRPGDLIYYAHDHGTGSTYHIAMYIGHGRMMESYTSGVPVRTTAVRFGKDYWGAVRVLGTPAATAGWKALTADEHAGDPRRAPAD
ncbi:MAG TPA: C40 family peptidase [Rhodanobacteraceae bacterium]